jgi:hypothetical protein
LDPRFDAEPEDREEYVEKIMTQIKAGPHLVTLCLAKDASMERVIEVLRRRTGISGQWQGRVEQEGDATKSIPRMIELAPINVTAPPNLPGAMTEARVFFGTLERKGSCSADLSDDAMLAHFAREAKMDQFWEVDRSWPGSNKAPPTVVAKRNEPKPMRQALPNTIDFFIAHHVEGESPSGQV